MITVVCLVVINVTVIVVRLAINESVLAMKVGPLSGLHQQSSLSGG